MKMQTEKTKRVAANVQATMAVEGMKPSRKAQVIGKQYLEGKLSSKEAIIRIKSLHAANFGK